MSKLGRRSVVLAILAGEFSILSVPQIVKGPPLSVQECTSWPLDGGKEPSCLLHPVANSKNATPRKNPTLRSRVKNFEKFLVKLS